MKTESYQEFIGADAPTESNTRLETADEFRGAPSNKNRSLGFNQAFGMYEKPLDAGKERLKALLGSGFADEDFVDSPGDLWLTTQIGFADTEEKKRQIIQQKYPRGDYKVRNFGEDGTFETATKDGKTWKIVGPLSQAAGAISPGEVAGTILGGASPQSFFLSKVARPAITGALGKGFEEKLYQTLGYEEPGRGSPTTKAAESFALGLAGGALTEGLLTPLVHRTVGIKGTPGAEKAMKAAEAEGLIPPTKGQATSNTALQMAYQQLQGYNTKARAEALKRFRSLKGNLKDWVDEYGISNFGQPQLKALYEHASYEVDNILKDVESGAKPFGAVVPELKKALEIFRKSESELKNRAYKDAFDVANADDVEFDFSRVYKAMDEAEKGVPVVGHDVPSPGAGDVGVAGPASGPGVVRYLTPEAALQAKIDKAKQVNFTLSRHNPDGDYVSSLEQINAIRRDFNEFAWDNVDNLQGQKALQIINAIDDSLKNPISGLTKDYLAAFEKAQGMHSAWKTALDLQKISRLNTSDPTTYENFVVGLMRPGNGPTLEIMEKLFKDTPDTMDSFRNTFYSYLEKDPSKIGDNLDKLKKQDPRMFQMIFKNPTDEQVLRRFGAEKDRLQNAWFAKQANVEMISEGQRVLDMLTGSPEVVAKRASDYLKFAGPEGRDSLKTALIYKLINESETIPTDELGESVVSAQAFSRAFNTHQDIIKQIFNPKEMKRLENLYNYAIKIKDVEVGVPEVASLSTRAGSDVSTSLALGEAGGQIMQAPGRVEKSKDGIIGSTARVTKDILLRVMANPMLINAILGLSEPATKKHGARSITEEAFQTMKNIIRVAPLVYYGAASRYENPDLQEDAPKLKENK